MEGATDIFSFGDICSDAIIILTRILAFELKHKRAFWVFREESLQHKLGLGNGIHCFFSTHIQGNFIFPEVNNGFGVIHLHRTLDCPVGNIRGNREENKQAGNER